MPITIKAHLAHGLDDPYRSAAENFLVLVTYQLDNYAAGQIPDITLHVQSVIWKFCFNFRLIYLFTEIIKVKYFCYINIKKISSFNCKYSLLFKLGALYVLN